jgi:hypothetical protein
VDLYILDSSAPECSPVWTSRTDGRGKVKEHPSIRAPEILQGSGYSSKCFEDFNSSSVTTNIMFMQYYASICIFISIESKHNVDNSVNGSSAHHNKGDFLKLIFCTDEAWFSFMTICYFSEYENSEQRFVIVIVIKMRYLTRFLSLYLHRYFSLSSDSKVRI